MSHDWPVALMQGGTVTTCKVCRTAAGPVTLCQDTLSLQFNIWCMTYTAGRRTRTRSRPVHRASGRASALGRSLPARAARDEPVTQQPRQRHLAGSCLQAAKQCPAPRTASMQALQTRLLQPRSWHRAPRSRTERQPQLAWKLPEQTRHTVARSTQQLQQHWTMAQQRLPLHQLPQQRLQGGGAQWPRRCAVQGLR